MILKGKNVCDFCFTPVEEGENCPKCGLTYENYKPEAGLLLPGTNLMGKYIIGRVLGRGGFGATYLAYSAELDKPVAIKEYYPVGIANRGKGEEQVCIVSDDKIDTFGKGAKRFYQEAQTMASFTQSKNVITVYEFFYANATVYYSMEYLEGISLKGYMDKKRTVLNEKQAVKVMRALAEALADIHEKGTLHRDVSPDNIFVCTNGDIKLIDFGAAKQVIGDDQRVYSVVLKQGFAPAEQYKEDGNQGPWTDIYALGASMYNAVSGRIPRDAISRMDEPELPFEGIDISPEFANIIRGCLHNEAEDRYQSAYQVLNALEALDGGDKIGNVESEVYKEASTYDRADIDDVIADRAPETKPAYDDEYVKHRERVGMIKGLITGAIVLALVIVISFIAVKLLTAQEKPTPSGDSVTNQAIEQTKDTEGTSNEAANDVLGPLIDPQGKG